MLTQPSLSPELFQYAQQLGFGELHFKLDAKTGLFAIVAIHSTKLGPALGGCRCRNYNSIDAAVKDALRLAQGMTYKAAITNLPLGGGKSVLIKPEVIEDRRRYFQVFGEFIEALGGRYITAVDSGTNPEDMDEIAKTTRHVTSTQAMNGDPSPFTATGVRRAMEAAVRFKLNKDNLEGLHVAIQGVGNVGKYLAHELHERGVKLTVTDTSSDAAQYCVDKFNASVVPPEDIYTVSCDIFAPCALGGVINDFTIPQFNTNIIVGSANNQLAELQHGEMLHEKGITYAPDYVANAGGLVYACAQYYKTPREIVNKQVDTIYDSTLAILIRAAKENRPSYLIADQIAEEKLGVKYL